MYKSLIRPFLFLFDAETIHHFTFFVLRTAHKLGFGNYLRKRYTVGHANLGREVFGLHFKNPVGLAAGFDKDARHIGELSSLGFGFIEIGTLTPKPQKGNPKKRLFRLSKDEAIINRMGFNNAGVFDAAERLKKKHNILVGGNIGKNKATPNDKAIKDYLICFDALFKYVDYFVVNVSSPNTPGLRELQEKGPLSEILIALKRQNAKLSEKYKIKERPILLKIAPDLNENQLSDIVDIVKSTKIDGVIATNTTIERTDLKSDYLLTEEQGGLSGKPLNKRSTEVIRFLAEQGEYSFPIIGVGGIHSPQDALEKLEAGADLVQIWTGLVYEGPGLIRQINEAILSEVSN